MTEPPRLTPTVETEIRSWVCKDGVSPRFLSGIAASALVVLLAELDALREWVWRLEEAAQHNGAAYEALRQRHALRTAPEDKRQKALDIIADVFNATANDSSPSSRGGASRVVLFVWKCKSCDCLWRDNLDESVSLFNGDQKSCQKCERGPTDDQCAPFAIWCVPQPITQADLDRQRWPKESEQ